MKLFILLFLSLILLSNSIEETKTKNERLTFKETIDIDNTYYLLNTEEEYIENKNLKKNEIYKNTSSYTYEWSNHPTNLRIRLNDRLPIPDSKGYRDMTKYDTVYFNLYNRKILNTKVTLVIECQERKPDEISDMTVAYKSYKIPMNFEGWKEIKINYRQLDDGHGGDLTKVSGLAIYSNGWGNTPNKETELYIDKISFTKLKYEFNMEESEITDDNYLNAINRLRYSLVGGGSLLTEKNENIVKIFKSNVKTAISVHKMMNTSGLPFDYPMNSSLDIYSNYYRIHQIAKGYAVEGGEIYKNKTYFKDIIHGLDYMHEHHYTKRFPKIFKGLDNWWHWDIGIPQTLVEIITFLKDELSQEQINKYLTPVNNYIFYPKLTMANRVDIAFSCIIAGIYQKDYKRIAISVEMLRELFDTVEIFDGFYEDGSFIQHEIYGYIGGYGLSLINSLSRISYILDDTCFRLDDDMKEKQYDWFVNSYIPFIYEGAFFDLIRGRDVTRNILGLASGNNLVKSITFATRYLKNDENIKLFKTFLKYLFEKNKDYYNKNLGVGTLTLLDEIIPDESIKPDKILNNFSKVYSRIDKAISHMNGVGIGLSFSSTRTGKYESMNGDNAIGWYQGDGMTYIYLTPNDYAISYWPNINPLRLPGTTVTNAPREKKGLSDKKAYAKYDFVGGTYSGVNMVAVMKFASESPGVNFNSSLIGNKAYFIFENCIILIGNNISCSDNYEVETIIENRKINGKFYIGDKEVTGDNGKVTDKYIYIENYGVIYIPDYKNVKYHVTNNKYIEIYFEHGKKIINENYKYYIFPNISKNDVNKYVNNIQILSDTENITVVKNKLNNVIEYVFWEKGSFDKVIVDNPCTIIIYENEFYISAPSQNIDIINVIIDEHNYQMNIRKGYTYKVDKIKNNENISDKSKFLNSSIIYIFLLFLLIL